MRRGAGDRLRWLAWLAAGIPWLVLVVFSALAAEVENGYELFGRFLGAVIMTLGVALLFRWLYTKGGGDRVWSPWVLAIATLAAVVVAAGAGRSADAGSDRDPPPEVNLERLIGDPPSGYRYAESPPAERRHFRRMLAAPGAEGFFMRDIVSRGRVAGVVVVATSSVDGSAEDVRRGMEDSTGRRATTTTLGDERILSVSVPGRVHQMVRVDRRAVAMVLVFPGYPAWKLARAILTG